MQALPKSSSLEFHPNVLENVRRFWDLNKPGKMEEAVNILDEWAKKQSHFLKTEFEPQFLERLIIASKGSIERAKSKLDKYCTLRSFLPQFYVEFNPAKDLESLRAKVDQAVLPKMTSQFYRVGIMRFNEILEEDDFNMVYKYLVSIAEYLRKKDYSNGMVLVMDYRKIDLFRFLQKLSALELRNAISVMVEGYATRVKGIHCITESKVIETLIALIKQMLSPTITSRIRVHKSEKCLAEYIDQDILPLEYGGKEKSISDLNDDLIEAMSSQEHLAYMNRMREYGTDEKLRPKDQFNESYIGMPGTFKTLTVD